MMLNKQEPRKATRVIILSKLIVGVLFLLLEKATEVIGIKLSVIQQATVTISSCGTGSGGVIIAGWVRPNSTSISYSVDEGTRTGDSLNLYKISSPSAASTLTKMVGTMWTFTAMRWDNTCAATTFYRLNNADLQTVSGTSLKFHQVFSLNNLAAGTYNLVATTSNLDPSLRNKNFYYGPTYILEFEASNSPANMDMAVLELAFGPSFMSSIDFL